MRLASAFPLLFDCGTDTKDFHPPQVPTNIYEKLFCRRGEGPSFVACRVGGAYPGERARASDIRHYAIHNQQYVHGSHFVYAWRHDQP